MRLFNKSWRTEVVNAERAVMAARRELLLTLPNQTKDIPVMTVSEPQFTVANIGCLLDGAMGWHNTYRLINLAVALGMELSDDDTAIVDRFSEGEGSDDDNGAVIDQGGIHDDAREYLGTLCAPGVVIEFDDGVYITTVCRTEWFDARNDECECGNCGTEA